MSLSHLNVLLKAFSDPSRLRILHLLRKGETCVGDIVSILNLTQPTVSRHLLYLKKSGLIEAQKKGLWIFYQLSKPKTKFHEKLLGCLNSCFKDIPEFNKDDLKAEKIRKSGGCCPD